MTSMQPPAFVRHRRTGTVHVALPERDRPAWWERMYRRRPLLAEFYPPTTLTTAIAAPLPCRCGVLAVQTGFGDRFEFVGRFSDDDLCVRCYAATPPDEQPMLFEHETGER